MDAGRKMTSSGVRIGNIWLLEASLEVIMDALVADDGDFPGQLEEG